MIAPPWRTTPLFVFFCLIAASAAAQQQAGVTADNSKPIPPESSTISRIWDLFEIDLPGTERTGQVKFSFEPHFRDVLDKGYVRIPFDFRWGVNDHFELNSDVESYFDDGTRKAHFGNGISQLHFGAKYAWLEWLKPTWETSVGFNSAIPVSRPPIELTDGHDHFTPYIVFGRKIDDVPGLSGYLNVRTDFVSSSSTPGNFGQNEPHSNSFTMTPGLLYDRHPWHYTLEVDGTTTRWIGNGSHDFLTIRPGILWDLPKKWVFKSQGDWLAGFSVTFVFGPDGNTVNTGGRLRGQLNLTKLFGGN